MAKLFLSGMVHVISVSLTTTTEVHGPCTFTVTLEVWRKLVPGKEGFRKQTTVGSAEVRVEVRESVSLRVRVRVGVGE